MKVCLLELPCPSEPGMKDKKIKVKNVHYMGPSMLISYFVSLRQSRPQDDSLTYAELELVRPRPEPPASSRPDPTPSSPDTVYAQIFFQEKQL